jgi:hypothetical protein
VHHLFLKDAFTEDGKPYDGAANVSAQTITDPASLQSLQEFPTFDGSKGGNMVHLE